MFLINPFRFPVLFVMLVLISCSDDNENGPAHPAFKSVRMEEPGFYSRELFFNDWGQPERVLTAVVSNGETIENTEERFYTPSGKVMHTILQGNYRYEYAYEGERIISTTEIHSGVLKVRTTFTYDASGRLLETGATDLSLNLPTGKTIYTYDVNGDLSIIQTYTFGNASYVPNFSFHFSDFDDQVGIDRYFSFYSFNPQLRLLNHNPGKLITKNKDGVIVTTEVYSYLYNKEGLPEKRSATVVSSFPDEPEDTYSFDVHYYYRTE
jgi:hypothetical protein